VTLVRPKATDTTTAVPIRGDGSRSHDDGQVSSAMSARRRVIFAEIETVLDTLDLVPRQAEDHLRATDGSARVDVEELADVRASLARVEGKLDELIGQVAMLDARAEYVGTRAPSRRVRSSKPCPLSSRELEILIYLADGNVYKQIAEQLSVAVSTVRTHLHHIYHKLGVVDRAQAVLLATRHGWI
jgi:DNA-binding CsgD family transcriptional regulator